MNISEIKVGDLVHCTKNYEFTGAGDIVHPAFYQGHDYPLSKDEHGNFTIVDCMNLPWSVPFAESFYEGSANEFFFNNHFKFKSDFDLQPDTKELTLTCDLKPDDKINCVVDLGGIKFNVDGKTIYVNKEQLYGLRELLNEVLDISIKL